MTDWIEVNIPWGDCYAMGTFCDFEKKLNKPGTLIEVYEVGSESHRKILLIGHINELGGICDDCRQVDSRTIVARYKIIWSEVQK